jgi:hypothetical protein
MILPKRSYLVIGAALLAAVSVVAASFAYEKRPVTVPGGTAIAVQLDQTVASDRNQSGDQFDATVAQPIVVDGKTVVPEGSQVTGHVVYAHKAGRLHGVARLQLDLDSVQVNGKSYEIQTSSTYRRGGNHDKRNLAFVGGGAGGGLLVGALAGGGKGALIGGPIGAGAGLAAAYFTANKNIRVPAETQLTFELAQPVSIKPQS